MCDMKECLEIPFDKDIYKGSDKIDVRSSHHGSFQVEEGRKTDVEKRLKEILNAFGELINFCEEKEIYAEQEA